jgi:hypothetical protein
LRQAGGTPAPRRSSSKSSVIHPRRNGGPDASAQACIPGRSGEVHSPAPRRRGRPRRCDLRRRFAASCSPSFLAIAGAGPLRLGPSRSSGRHGRSDAIRPRRNFIRLVPSIFPTTIQLPIRGRRASKRRLAKLYGGKHGTAAIKRWPDGHWACIRRIADRVVPYCLSPRGFGDPESVSRPRGLSPGCSTGICCPPGLRTPRVSARDDLEKASPHFDGRKDASRNSRGGSLAQFPRTPCQEPSMRRVQQMLETKPAGSASRPARRACSCWTRRSLELRLVSTTAATRRSSRCGTQFGRRRALR